MRPPQIYDLPGTKGQTWPTYNKLIDGINAALDRFNQGVRTANGEILGGIGSFPVVVGMENVGVKVRHGQMTHCVAWFRETELQKMLHLIPKQQAKFVKRVLNFFQLNTPNGPNQYIHPHSLTPPHSLHPPPPPQRPERLAALSLAPPLPLSSPPPPTYYKTIFEVSILECSHPFSFYKAGIWTSDKSRRADPDH